MTLQFRRSLLVGAVVLFLRPAMGQLEAAAPEGFDSALSRIHTAYANLKEIEKTLDLSNPPASPKWNDYLDWYQTWEFAKAQQEVLEDEIRETGKLDLYPGESYSFELKTIGQLKRLRISSRSWFLTAQNYWIQWVNTAKGVHIDIYMPIELEKIQSFVPTETSLIDEEGRETFLTADLVLRASQTLAISMCDQARNWQPPTCTPITSNIRQDIINKSQPSNFPTLRYESPPRSPGSTDCSHFVNEIYKSAGLYYPYFNTSAVGCLRTFEKIPAAQENDGDMILFSDHMGIIAADREVISATVGGRERRAMRSVNDPKFQSTIQKYPRTAFGKSQSYRWTCQ